MGTGEKKCLSYPKESWKMGTGEKKQQKWQYNENALRICKKRTANLENVKKCFQGKREKRSKSEQNHKMLLNQRHKRAAKQRKGWMCFKIDSCTSSKTR